VTGDFFERLEAELGSLTRQGRHLEQAPGGVRRGLATLGRRGAVIVVLAALFLAVSLAGESTTSAGGNMPLAHVPVVRGR